MRFFLGGEVCHDPEFHPSLLRRRSPSEHQSRAAAGLVLPLAADRRAPAIAGVDMYPHRNHVLMLVLLPPSAGPFRPPFAAGDVARAAGVGC